MVHICENYAKRYHITFNANKSQVIIYKAYNVKPPDPCIVINRAPVKCFNNVIHLGHLLTENVYEFNVSKCIGDFNRQCNMFFADFKHCSCCIRNILFQRYCTNFYGSQLLPFFDVKIQELYIVWRVAVHRVWHVPWTTYNNMLANIAGVMDSEFFFEKRFIKFIKMALVSENCTVHIISNMGRYGSHSIMGANFKHLNRKYCMDESNVYAS